VRHEDLSKLIEFNYLIGSRIRDLRACSTVPQPLRYGVPYFKHCKVLRRVAVVRTDVSEEPSASIIRVTRIGELGTTLVLVTANVVPSSSILVTLMMEALRSSEMSVLTIFTGRNITENGIPRSHRRENLKSFIALTG
jgi:hypothetical protein